MTAEQLNYKMRRAIGTYDNSLVISMADSCVKVANEALELKEAEHLNKLRAVKDEISKLKEKTDYHIAKNAYGKVLEIIDNHLKK